MLSSHYWSNEDISMRLDRLFLVKVTVFLESFFFLERLFPKALGLMSLFDINNFNFDGSCPPLLS